MVPVTDHRNAAHVPRLRNRLFHDLVTEAGFGPAGTDLLDRVIAIEASGVLVVSAPAGVRADYLDASDAVLGSRLLTNGAGAGPLDAQAAATEGTVTSVRILDADGTLVAETDIFRVEG